MPNSDAKRLREEHRLRVSENWVLMKTFRSTEKDVAAEWIILHDMILYDWCSGDEIKDVMGGACGM
jgi:hypothetical protein